MKRCDGTPSLPASPTTARRCAMAAPAVHRVCRGGGGVFGLCAPNSLMYEWFDALCAMGNQSRDKPRGISFARQSYPNDWDYAEANPLLRQQNFGRAFLGLSHMDCGEAWKECIAGMLFMVRAQAIQADAPAQHQSVSLTRSSPLTLPTTTTSATPTCPISFMSGCGRSLRSIFPDLFATLAVPKAEELVATPIAMEAKKKPRRSFSTA